jgi:hypothetical protein
MKYPHCSGNAQLGANTPERFINPFPPLLAIEDKQRQVVPAFRFIGYSNLFNRIQLFQNPIAYKEIIRIRQRIEHTNVFNL